MISAEILSVEGAVPKAGEIFSQGPPFEVSAVALQLNVPLPALLIESDCGGGLAPPCTAWKLRNC